MGQFFLLQPPPPPLSVFAILNIFALFSVENKTFPSKVVSGTVLFQLLSFSLAWFLSASGYILSVSNISWGRLSVHLPVDRLS